MTDKLHRFGVVVNRIAALAILAFLVSIVTYSVRSGSWDQLRAVDEDIAQGIVIRQRLQAVMSLAGRIDPAVRQKDVARYSSDFLTSGEDSLVVAQLQARLRDMVMSNNAELSSVRMLPAKTVSNQTYLGLRMQIQGHMASVHQIIQSIEYGVPLLFVERAILRRDERFGVVPVEGADPVPFVFAELDVYGAKWAELADPNSTTAGKQR